DVEGSVLFCECSTLSLCLNIAAVGRDPGHLCLGDSDTPHLLLSVGRAGRNTGFTWKGHSFWGARSPTPVEKCSQCPQGGTTIGQSSMDNLHVCVCVCVFVCVCVYFYVCVCVCVLTIDCAV